MAPITRLLSLATVFLVGSTFATTVCTVPHKPGGDDYNAIALAFASCSQNAQVVFQSGVVYNLNQPLNVTGLNNVQIKLDGSISLPNNILYKNKTTAFIAISGTNVDIIAPADSSQNGRIIGNGQVWWDKGISSGRYATLQVSVKRGSIQNLKIEQSPFYNLVLDHSSHLRIDGIKFTSVSANSVRKPFQIQNSLLHADWVNSTWSFILQNLPRNTDGIDFFYSSFINVSNAQITNGDDCISVKRSLGITPGVYEYSLRIRADDTSCTNCSNGARIKTWPGKIRTLSAYYSYEAALTNKYHRATGGVGLVQDITFNGFAVTGVDRPIYIDQYYCDTGVGCRTGKSLVQIQRVNFNNFTGTSSGAKSNNPVNIMCSADAPCQEVYLSNISITSPMANVSNICTNVVDNKPIGITCVPGKISVS
ncbi:pectin lyase fold/virulence factor [Jimgerdemannia flammicorona]|uniref:Pectin lyase fold/virulence factor n=1 Tax=Jimgerdemannia flammicorona TaxID=994334 RepID=A0A433DC52_9FUNG|nr:pectin lyase fold/virulence factor [Jimgerdemannia flammicorona]